MDRQNERPLELIGPALRRERARTGMSLSELARVANVAKSTLSQLESGVGNPNVETLWALAVALGIPFSRLLDPPRPAVTVLRKGEGLALPAERANYVATLLASAPPRSRRDLYLLTLEPGPPRDSDAHLPGTLEHAIVAAGRARIGPADDPVEAGPGDYVCYPGDVPHTCAALDPGTVIILMMEHF
jgi:transcriptional regulator with XRE-family HTH domain